MERTSSLASVVSSVQESIVFAVALPPLPQCGEGKRAEVGQVKIVAVLEKLVGGHQAAAAFKRLAVRGLRVDFFATGVEALALERGALGRLVGRLPPEGEQTPLGGDQFALAVVASSGQSAGTPSG